MNLETIIGLEIHVQLATESKMFCGCANVDPGIKPNSSVCPVCMGHPGVMPVVNKKALEYGIKASLALNCQVQLFSKFDRKSYFYPDLPKGYQISQYDEPLALGGRVEFFSDSKKNSIPLERLHLEEDTAKNIHEKDYALIDFNRSGIPLMEIVTKPEIKSPLEARLFLQELRLIMRYLGVSNADMEKGQLRCDANISLRSQGDMDFYPKTEIKNLNSFKSVERALEYEVKRQTELWEKGEIPQVQATRGWDENKQITTLQRVKEEASDYRYFPEPDLPPLHFTDEFVSDIKNLLPELPQAKRERFLVQYAFKPADVDILVQDKKLSEYTESVISELVAWLEANDSIEGSSDEIWDQNKDKLCKLVSGWLLSKLFKLVNEKKIPFCEQPITAENFAEFLTLVYDRKVNSSAAQVLLEEMFVSGKDPDVILEEKDLSQSRDVGEIGDWADEVIMANPEQVKQFQEGKDPVIKFLIGMVMKKSAGKADPQEVERILREKLK